MTGLKHHLAKSFLLLSIFLLSIYCNKQDAPVLSKIEVTTIAGTVHMNSVACGGGITSNNVVEIIERGVCWDTVISPLITAHKVSYGKGAGIFSTEITGLDTGRVYYIRAYAKTSSEVIYGNELKVTTLALAQVHATAPTAISATSAVFNGEVITDGGAVVTDRGVCWNTGPNPSISNSKASAGMGTGSFTVDMTGLAMATAYYARGYAITNAGTSYGNEVSFTTLGLPLISTIIPGNILQKTAVSGGNITSDGGATITARGVCWATHPVPTIMDDKTTDGVGVGQFTSSLTDLQKNTKYYIRAYASNSVGTGYGEELSFTTKALTVPTVVTSPIVNITQTSAQGGGTVTSDGGSPVLERGICYSDYPMELIVTDPRVRVIKEGAGTGTFVSPMTTLYPFTFYGVRAYATNSEGTGYGEVKTLTTLAVPEAAPILRTPASNSVVPCCYVNFTWTVSISSEFSCIEISRQADFSEAKYVDQTLHPSGVFSTCIGGTSFQIDMNDATLNGYWYWRVRSVGAGVAGPWSAIGVFIFSK